MALMAIVEPKIWRAGKEGTLLAGVGQAGGGGGSGGVVERTYG